MLKTQLVQLIESGADICHNHYACIIKPALNSPLIVAHIENMGLDFSYLLYFKREHLWDVLQSVISLSKPVEKTSQIVFPDYTVALAMESWGKPEGTHKFDDPIFEFVLMMYFPPDMEIWEYLSELSSDLLEEWSRESPLGLPIGCIYLSVYNDLNIYGRTGWDPDLVMLEFGTTGSTMSILFSESDSIRLRFEHLLEAHHGVCGILNMENSGRLIWWDGHPVDIKISNPLMNPSEIPGLISQPPGI